MDREKLKSMDERNLHWKGPPFKLIRSNDGGVLIKHEVQWPPQATSTAAIAEGFLVHYSIDPESTVVNVLENKKRGVGTEKVVTVIRRPTSQEVSDYQFWKLLTDQARARQNQARRVQDLERARRQLEHVEGELNRFNHIG